ncbi:MAG: ferric reductase-like transmembrane domain-containing protein [Phycisphaerales bacterium]|nr:ferric reductase-like transmembrane domain-containing protein [Phycisphaerales bacterium]
MSHQYVTVQWNRHKRIYDLLLGAGVVLFLAAFMIGSLLLWRGDAAISAPILIIRATGVCAFTMLTLILAIGPLARLDRRFLPLLYNRRHFGVATFVVAAAHAALNLLFYHGFGSVNPLVSLLTNSASFTSLTAFPFELLGVVAFAILFVMAATSHDFWLRNLSPVVWKSLHLLVYVAYGLLVLHVVLGAMQTERSPVYPALVLGSLAIIVILHLLAGLRENTRPSTSTTPDTPWVRIGTVDEIPDREAKIVCLAGRERIAVFRYDGRVSAVSNVCAHQAGPLGEGRVVDGCITCPWHGYQYLPDTGTSPPPYTETIPTYAVRIEGRDIYVNPAPNPPGTPVEPARFEEHTTDA